MADSVTIHMEVRHFRTKRAKKFSKSGYRLIRFSGSVRQDLVCRACSGVVREPVECVDCGMLLCKGCWRRLAALMTNGAGEILECPGCKKVTHVRSSSRLLKQFILSLTVYCKYKHMGCEVTLPLSAAKEHERKCQFQVIACGNVGNCDVKEKLKNMTLVEEFYGKQTYVCSSRCQQTLHLKRLIEENDLPTVLSLFHTAASCNRPH